MFGSPAPLLKKRINAFYGSISGKLTNNECRRPGAVKSTSGRWLESHNRKIWELTEKSFDGVIYRKDSNLVRFGVIRLSIFHQRPPPPGHDSTGVKPLPRDSHCVQNPSPRDKIGSQKSHPPGHKVNKFYNIYKLSLTLFEMKSFIISTNKMVCQ